MSVRHDEVPSLVGPDDPQTVRGPKAADWSVEPALDSANAAESTQTLEEVAVRRGSWLDRLVNRSYTDRFLQALTDQGWHLEPWLAPDESAYGWFAYPPGAVTDDRRYVLVPDRIEPGRAAANLVAALRRASGSFTWED